MSCNHCKTAVEKVLSKVDGIKSYTVDLETGEAVIEGNPDQKVVIDEINKLGYRATLAK